jgi:hypothetical protein
MPLSVQDPAEGTKQMTEVEVELYSGRPNPRLSLSPEATAALQQRLDELPPAGTFARATDALGYRGLRVTGIDGAGTEVEVSAGIVEIRHGAAVRQLADPGRRLELWLVETVAAQMQQGEGDYILKDLRR